ncbi:precorrin-2 C(20)-methyltransferase [Aestuariirhabdus litorea]|uniref:Precorrin-2 C(20)-methyltransferase n=1 Tax=Aestuariirhabdus litorea TaxID=2528527 RepID=A0A3P3VQB6_9GAMM|nr:precorrin-2 C(20)-methyltransferase [Aestuariirhabdus litorea]RRJ84517.1 precorrin-2 C(20)-methyltransferase [Aestuariirhabdus litorea]RWW97742.1 precorrin-2 C(20)-methyltransferase [Endozoicomonadaceae bacterium GTF-13]
MSLASGTFTGVGVGPGAPDLLTLRAVRAIAAADLLVYIQNPEGFSLGRHIAREALAMPERNPQQCELPIPLNMSKDRKQINLQYDRAAEQISEHLGQGGNAVFLCEGDPLFFGSFIYMQSRLQERFPCSIIPGVTSVSAASAAVGIPLTLIDENLAVLSARTTDQAIGDALTRFHSVALLKAGPQLPRLLSLLEASGRLGDGVYLERIGHDDQRIVHDLGSLSGTTGPYFSLLLITRRERPLR